MTICKTYEEYKKALDNFREYMEMVMIEQMPYVSRFDSSTVDGVNPDKSLYNYLYEYDMVTKEQLQELLDKEGNSLTKTLKDIINNVLVNYGSEYTRGTLIGLEITEEDFYYIYRDNEGKVNYCTCVGKIGD